MRAIPGQRLRGRDRPTVVRCQCGAELCQLAPGERLTTDRSGQLRRTTCDGCGLKQGLAVQGESGGQ